MAIIMQMVTNRLHPPHGACNDELGYQHDMYALNSNASYSKLSCLKSCYQAIVERHCNCSVPSYYVVNRDNVCNMTDDIVSTCTLPSTCHEEKRHLKKTPKH